MSRVGAVAVGPPLALFVAIALVETDTAGLSAPLLGALLGGVAPYLLVPTSYRTRGGAIGLGVSSLILGYVFAVYGTLIWLAQYLLMD